MFHVTRLGSILLNIAWNRVSRDKNLLSSLLWKYFRSISVTHSHIVSPFCSSSVWLENCSVQLQIRVEVDSSNAASLSALFTEKLIDAGFGLNERFIIMCIFGSFPIFLGRIMLHAFTTLQRSNTLLLTALSLSCAQYEQFLCLNSLFKLSFECNSTFKHSNIVGTVHSLPGSGLAGNWRTCLAVCSGN